MQHNPRGTKYLLRFDDICPTMNWKVWSEIEAALVQRDLKPILAVVPDNQDQVLKVNIPRNDVQVTVAGVEQEEKLRRGVEIFERHGVKPRLWIAPSNSFDASTVSLLSRFGISMICDGYFRFPFVCRRNMFWVPQQLFCFRPAPPGIWTVCYHHNHWTAADLRKFRDDLRRYGPEISSLDDIVQEWEGRRSWWSAFLCTSPRLSPLLIRGQLKLVSWWRSLTAMAYNTG